MSGDGMPSAGQAWISALKSFLLRRWRGEAPLATVFWRDMMIVGTAINMAATAAAAVLFASDLSIVLALLVFFAPLPWNVFLFLVVWQSADRVTDRNAWAAKAASVVWLVAAITI